jgi:hypothetical protein
MELLDFAPEIFQHIVHDHVSDVGFFEALKLRTVCSECPAIFDVFLYVADFVRDVCC